MQEVARAVLEGIERARVGLIATVIEGDWPRRVYVSQAAADILGYSVQELLAQRSWETVAPWEREKVDAFVAAAQRNETPEPFELAAVHKSGRIVHVQCAPSLTEIAGERSVLIFFLDVTSQHETLDALARSERRLSSLMESAPDAIAVQGPNGIAAYVNPAMLKLLGLDRVEDVIGRSTLEFMHPDDRGPMLHRQRQLVEKGTALGSREYRILRPDGSIVTAEFYSMPIEYDGQPAFLAFAHDTTDRKRMEEGMVRADRLAALGQLAAGVAHEINNPLAYVRLHIERIHQNARSLASAPDAAKQAATLADSQESLVAALGGLDRVASIARDLRVFARDEVDKPGSVDLADVVGRAVAIVANQLRHRARLVVDAAPAPVRVLGNAPRLEQVVVNLLVNAAQALPIESVQTNEIRISVREEMAGGVLDVTDNGPGVPPTIASRIFEPFFTTKSAGEGTGLGLAVCERIVTSYGGRIELVRPPAGGATFRVWLPAHDYATVTETVEPRLVSVPAPESTARRLHILIIDDEVAIASVLRSLLSEHEVETCTDAATARHRLEFDEFDLVLCDLMMPGATGMDLWDELRQKHPGREERVVFMTGGAFEGRASDFLQRTRNVVLEKPFGIAAVRAALEEAQRRVGA